MSTDGDNIVRGRIRRWVAVNGNAFNSRGQERRAQLLTLKEDVALLNTKVLGSAPNVDVVIQKNGDA